MLLSIIIPCYNVAAYLQNLLYCIKQQIDTRDDIEIIAVNDGSKDNTLDILQQMAIQWKSLKIIDQVNGGPAKARNSGLERATGEYLWFVDADDYISSQSIAILLEEIAINPTDVICFNYRETDIEGKLINIYKNWHYRYNVVTTGLEAYATNNIPAFLWNRIIKRKLIKENKITFNIIPEDEDFLLETYIHAKSFRFTQHILYDYKIMTTSFSRGNAKTFEKYYWGYWEILNKYKTYLEMYHNNIFWTKMLFNCCRNLIVNYNRTRLLGDCINVKRCMFYRQLKRIITQYQHRYTDNGTLNLKITIIKYMPYIIDWAAYLKYRIHK